MMRNRAIGLAALAMLLCLLAGCSLALADAGEAEADRLIGVFVTREHLDLYDFDRQLADNAHKLAGGGDVVFDNDARYQGRLYATLETKPWENYTGDGPGYSYTYTFGEMEGYALCRYDIPPEEGSYTSTEGDGFSNLHFVVGNNNSLEGTLYIAMGTADIFSINPVYQQADGQVYATTGDSYSLGDAQSPGAVFTVALSETTTVRRNGETREENMTVTVALETMLAPREIVILHMGADSVALGRDAYRPDTLPDTLARLPGTAYYIVETHALDSEGQPTVARELALADADGLSAYVVREDSVCVAHYMPFE